MTLLVLGCLMLLLAGAPAGYGQRLNLRGWWLTESLGFGRLAHADRPELTATAALIGSGLVVLVLGAIL